jgi:hypothetical protein
VPILTRRPVDRGSSIWSNCPDRTCTFGAVQYNKAPLRDVAPSRAVAADQCARFLA